MNVLLRVDKLRKILALAFGALSLFFAAVAVRQYIQESCRENIGKTNVTYSDWGPRLKSEARKSDKLIFFKTSNSEEIPDIGNLRKLLDAYYIYSEMNPDAWPADYAILNNMLASATGKKQALKAGVLSPKMRPIFMAAEIKAERSRNSPNIEDVLRAIAVAYSGGGRELQKSATKTAAVINEAARGRKTNIEISVTTRGSILNSEGASLLKFFQNPQAKDEPLAILTENARLAAKIAAFDIRQNAARRAASIAEETLLERFSKDGNTLGEKMLIARALSDFATLGNSENTMELLKNFADKLSATQSEDGFFADNGGAPLLRDTALGISVLAGVYKTLPNKRYIAAAEKAAHRLAQVLQEYLEMPAVADLSEASQASSLEYALTARAFADMHAATQNPEYLKSVKRTFDEWNQFYMTPSGLWSVNSENSPLAEFARTVFVDDSNFPSYVGEAAQTIRYMEAADPEFRINNAEKIERIVLRTLTLTPVIRARNASLKLSVI